MKRNHKSLDQKASLANASADDATRHHFVQVFYVKHGQRRHISTWAKAHGHKLGRRGQLPQDVIAAYYKQVVKDLE